MSKSKYQDARIAWNLHYWLCKDIVIVLYSYMFHMEGQNYIDTTIKVIVDVIAKLTNQPSPTGNVHPTKHVTKTDSKSVKKDTKTGAQATVSQTTQDMKKITDDGMKKATGFLHNLGDTLEKYADQAIKQADKWLKQANEWLQKWQKFVEENSKMVMEEWKKLEGGLKKQAKKINLDEISNDSD